MKNIKTLGQVWTPDHIAQRMVNLLSYNMGVLDPCTGAGAFLPYIYSPTALEIDPIIAHESAIIQDFFSYPVTNKFDSIIMNPPYLRSRFIEETTKQYLKNNKLSGHAGLQVWFMYKAICHLNDGGELVAILPDFTKPTGAKELNDLIVKTGTITYWEDLSGQKIFDGATPDVVILKFVKRKPCYSKYEQWQAPNGNLFVSKFKPYCSGIHRQSFIWNQQGVTKVAVGAVAKSLKDVGEGDTSLVCSKTAKTGSMRSMSLDQEWLRPLNGLKTRLFCLCKTRSDKPFFTTPEPQQFDGSVLGLFYQDDVDVELLCEYLNDIDWKKLGLRNADGRFQVGQSTLQTLLVG